MLISLVKKGFINGMDMILISHFLPGIPSGKLSHNYGKIHHFIAGKIHYFYGHGFTS